MLGRIMGLAGMAVLVASEAVAADAYLRLRCDGPSEGAEVRINNQLKGQCPIDLAVPEGKIQLSVRKELGRGQFHLYEKELFLSANAMKRENVIFGEIQFTAEGRKLEDERLAAEASRVAAEKEAARLQAERDAAEKVAARIAAIKAAPGMTRGYLDAMSSKDKSLPSSFALFSTTYAPVMLPPSTTTDLIDGKPLADASDPTIFANPDAMIARASRARLEREASAPAEL